MVTVRLQQRQSLLGTLLVMQHLLCQLVQAVKQLSRLLHEVGNTRCFGSASVLGIVCNILTIIFENTIPDLSGAFLAIHIIVEFNHHHAVLVKLEILLGEEFLTQVK